MRRLEISSEWDVERAGSGDSGFSPDVKVGGSERMDFAAGVLGGTADGSREATRALYSFKARSLPSAPPMQDAP